MSIFNLNFKKDKTPQPEQPVKNETKSFKFSQVITAKEIVNDFIPRFFSYKKNQVNNYWGIDNNYNLVLENLYYSSALHASIIQDKTKYAVGAGYELIGCENINDYKIKNKLNLLLDFTDGTNNLQYILNKIAFDYFLYGAFALLVEWDAKFEYINKITHKPVRGIRINYTKDYKPVKFLYNFDWQYKVNADESYVAFDPYNRKDTKQILYFKRDSLYDPYYGEPDYISGANSILNDGLCTNTTLNTLKNNLVSPNIITLISDQAMSDEELDAFEDAWNDKYTANVNKGKNITGIANHKDNAPIVTSLQQIDHNNFITLLKSTEQQIVFAHSIKSKALIGGDASGMFTNNGEVINAFEIFNNLYLTPIQAQIESQINKIFRLNGFPCTLKLKKFNLFPNQEPKK